MEATNYAKEIANLNVSMNFFQNLLNRHDKIGGLGRSLQSIITNLKYFISTVDCSANEVLNSSQFLSNSSDDSSLAIEEIARTIEQMSEGATEQAKDREDVVIKIDELGEILDMELECMENRTK